MAHVIRHEPSTIAELKTVIEDFAVNMSEEEVWKMVRNTKRKAELCRDNFGGHLKHLLKKKQVQVLAIHSSSFLIDLSP